MFALLSWCCSLAYLNYCSLLATRHDNSKQGARRCKMIESYMMHYTDEIKQRRISNVTFVGVVTIFHSLSHIKTRSSFSSLTTW
jgi:hypothetical protein